MYFDAMGPFLAILFFIVNGIVCGELCKHLARSKGLDVQAWKTAGFFLGLIAVLAAAGMPDKKFRSLIKLLCVENNVNEGDINAALDDNEFSDEHSFVTNYGTDQEKIWELALSSLPRNLKAIVSRDFSIQNSRKIVLISHERKTIASFVAKDILGSFRWYMRVYR